MTIDINGLFGKYVDFIPRYREFVSCLDSGLARVLRVNLFRMKVEKVVKRLSRYGIVVEGIGWYPGALLVKYGIDVASRCLEHYLGFYYIMDLVSLVPPYLILKEGGEEVLLDVAAAPGGKALALADGMVGRGLVVANEPNRERFNALASNVDRMGYPNVLLLRVDARRLPRLPGVSMVLFDAPCSTEIHFDRIRDIGPYLDGSIYRRYSRLQIEILGRLYEVLDPGTPVYYTVCTLNPMECEYVVSQSLRIGYEVEEIKDIPLEYCRGVEKWGGFDFSDVAHYCVRIYPHLNEGYGCNIGFSFLCKLVR